MTEGNTNSIYLNYICNVEAEAGNAGEQPDRNSLMTEDDQGEVINPASPYFEIKSSLVSMPKKTQNEKEKNNLNLLEKSVQKYRG